MMLTKEERRVRNNQANRAIVMLASIGDERDRIVKATEQGDINALALVMQGVVRRLVSRWNQGYRPGGSKSPTAHVRQETREQETARFKRLHKQPSAKVKCGVKNTQTGDEPDLSEDDVLSAAEECWFEEYVATGELGRLQKELGATHGFYLATKRSFGRAKNRFHRREKKHRHSKIKDRVSRDIDGLPITSGSDWHEDERLCGRQGAGESLQEREHSLYLAIEARAVERLAKAKDGKLLTAVASRLDWPTRKIGQWLRENGSRISDRTAARLVRRAMEVMQEAGRDDLDTDPDTDTDPCCERIGRVIPEAWRTVDKAPSKRLEFNSVRSFPDSIVDKTQFADEYTIANARGWTADKSDSPSWAVSQAAIDGHNARICAVDSLLIANGMQSAIGEIEELVKVRANRHYSKLPRTSMPDKPTIGTAVRGRTLGTDHDYDLPGKNVVEVWEGTRRVYY